MKHLHFVGIGGARLRGLAKLYFDRGFQISGSDCQPSRDIDNLVKLGIKVAIGHKAEQIAGADLVVYTTAVGAENPEVLEALRLGIPVMEGAELLGRLMEEIGAGIAVAGTHGKTTTTAMTALVLTKGGLDPTVFIGGELEALGGNHRTGKSRYMIVEACEFRKSFLKLKPRMELITNIDWDHPDCFPSLDAVVQTFKEFVALLPRDGFLTVWGDDPNAAELARVYPGRSVTFGYRTDLDWSVGDLRAVAPLGMAARLNFKGKPLGELNLKVPGRHNLQNALGAVAIAAELGVEPDYAVNVLKEFAGVKKRFEIKGDYRGVTIVDDYAHHPAAIRMTLAAARQFFKGRIWCAFQPHLFSRTKYLLPEFAKSFNDADILVLADIYPAREVDAKEVSSFDLARETSQYHPDVRYLGDFERIFEHLRTKLQPGDLLITMGAGNIWKVGEWLLDQANALKS